MQVMKFDPIIPYVQIESTREQSRYTKNLSKASLNPLSIVFFSAPAIF
jgi:hypothetical protein